MKRVKDTRDFSREARASQLYEELRRLDIHELRIEARLSSVDPASMGRQQVIGAIIDKHLSKEER